MRNFRKMIRVGILGMIVTTTMMLGSIKVEAAEFSVQPVNAVLYQMIKQFFYQIQMLQKKELRLKQDCLFK